ncbi:LURP-one-related family protein [Mycobacterium tuberculosis]
MVQVKRKQSSTGVNLGDDVLSLRVEPQKDYSFIMALVAVQGLISGKL